MTSEQLSNETDTFDNLGQNCSKISSLELGDDESNLEATAEAALRAYDKNKDGFVSKSEFATVSGRRLTKQQVRTNQC